MFHRVDSFWKPGGVQQEFAKVDPRVPKALIQRDRVAVGAFSLVQPVGCPKRVAEIGPVLWLGTGADCPVDEGYRSSRLVRKREQQPAQV